MKKRMFFWVILALLSGMSCEKKEQDRTSYDNVLIYYAGGYNNLSAALFNNLNGNTNSLTMGDVPDINSGNAIIILTHNTKGNANNYYEENPPCLIRLYKKNGEIIQDTLKIYTGKVKDTNPEFLRSVLAEIKEQYKSEHYGLLYSSHATGWLPVNHISTKSIGNQFESGNQASPSTVSANHEMDIKDFANAIPMHLDYILFDCCLMSCIEAAYELKNKCDYIVASPTEILSTGFIYSNISSRLFKPVPDLQGVCEDYYNYYKASSNPSATIALLDCSKIELLAETTKKIITGHRENFRRVDRDYVQKYYRDSRMPYFYDFRHLIETLKPTEKELETFDRFLDEFVIYKAATPYFMTIKIEKFSGLSIYIPDDGWEALNEYYSNLAWDKEVNLIDSWKNRNE